MLLPFGFDGGMLDLINSLSLPFFLLCIEGSVCMFSFSNFKEKNITKSRKFYLSGALEKFWSTVACLSGI